MKNYFVISLYTLLFFLTSCSKKVEVLTENEMLKKATITETYTTPTIESLGSPFKSSNVMLNINPANPNFAALVTFHPNTTTGYELIMIDNGVSTNSTPLQAFRFVSVNLDNGNYKFISIQNPTNNTVVTNSVGRIVRYVFGNDKNLYIVTEGSYDGGGHVIQYNPNTQQAFDLGKPFYLNGKYLDIYSINVGSDGMLYGGSFGGAGEVMTFRYNYKNFDVDTKTLNNTSRYVSYISGDANYTYAACGENSWYLYAIPKNNSATKTLLSANNTNSRIELVTNVDDPYATMQSMHYQLNNGVATALGTNNTPQTNQILYTPYALETINQLQIKYNNTSNQLTYTLSGSTFSTITLNGISTNIAATGASAFVNNTLYTCSNNLTQIAKYNDAVKWNVLGSIGYGVKSIAASNNNTVLIGGYPKGNLFEYQPYNSWNLNADAVANGTLNTNASNPSLLARQQNADAAGVYGPMYISAIAQTKNNIIISGGDNDRITASSGRALSMGTYNNGNIKNFSPQTFSNYQFAGMCLNNDSNAVYVAASANSGNAVIFEYNPNTNSLTKTINLPFADPGNIVLYNKDTLAGFYNDVVYLLDVKTGKMVWQKTLGGGQRIFGITITPNKQICVIHMYLQAIHFKVVSFNYTKNNVTTTTLGEITDSFADESTKPTWLTCTTLNANEYKIYITGLKELYRLNVATNK